MARPTNKERWKKNIGEAVSKMTPERIQKLKDAFAIDASIKEACFYAEISVSTYYNWAKENPELLEEFEALRQTPILKARQTVVKGLEGDKHFSMQYLSKKMPHEFSDAQRIQHTGSVGTEPTPLAGDLAEIRDKYEKELRERIMKPKDKAPVPAK